MMKRQLVMLTAIGFLVTIGWTACDSGPMQRAGEKMDQATDQDKLIGKGPMEKAGRSVDKAVDAVKELPARDRR